MPRSSRFPTITLLLATLALGGCDPRDCWLGISHGDCYAEGAAQAQFPQDDSICRQYGLTPGTRDYAICRQDKRHERALTARESDFGFLQNPLAPDVTVVAPVPAAPQR